MDSNWIKEMDRTVIILLSVVWRPSYGFNSKGQSLLNVVCDPESLSFEYSDEDVTELLGQLWAATT